MTTEGRLKTMEPDPVWDAESYEDTVETLAAFDDAVFRVWGGDWCKDCRAQLPEFGAALAAAEIPEERVEHYPTEKEDDGSKTGPGVAEYDIEFIPTVVVERVSGSDTSGTTGGEPGARDGEELARFVEDADVPIAVALAEQLRAVEADA